MLRDVLAFFWHSATDSNLGGPAIGTYSNAREMKGKDGHPCWHHSSLGGEGGQVGEPSWAHAKCRGGK